MVRALDWISFDRILKGQQRRKVKATITHYSCAEQHEAFGYASVRARAKKVSLGHSLRSRPITDIAPLVDAFTIKVLLFFLLRIPTIMLCQKFRGKRLQSLSSTRHYDSLQRRSDHLEQITGYQILMSIGEHPAPCPLSHLLTRSVYAGLPGRQLSIYSHQHHRPGGFFSPG